VEEKEKIKVYVDLQNGKCVCICLKSKKGCDKNCSSDTVTRDRFAGWKRTMLRDRFGR